MEIFNIRKEDVSKLYDSWRTNIPNEVPITCFYENGFSVEWFDGDWNCGASEFEYSDYTDLEIQEGFADYIGDTTEWVELNNLYSEEPIDRYRDFILENKEHPLLTNEFHNLVMVEFKEDYLKWNGKLFIMCESTLEEMIRCEEHLSGVTMEYTIITKWDGE